MLEQRTQAKERFENKQVTRVNLNNKFKLYKSFVSLKGHYKNKFTSTQCFQTGGRVYE